MNPNSIDYLYQVTTSVSDRAPSTSRTDDNSPDFDDHLSQASSTVFDVIQPTNRTSSDSIYSPSTDSSVSDRYNAPAAPSDLPADNSTSSSQASSSDDAQDSTPVAPQTQPQKPQRHRDKDSNDRGKRHKHDGNHVTSAGSTPTAAKNDAAKINTDADTTVNGASDVTKANVKDDGSLPKTPAESKPTTDSSATEKTAITDAVSALKIADAGKANAGKTDANLQLETNSKEQPASDAVEAPKTGKNAVATGKSQTAATAKAKNQSTIDTVKAGQSDSEAASSTISSTNSADQAAPTEAQTTAGAKQVTSQVSDKPSSKFDDGKTGGGDKQSAKSTDQVDPAGLNNNANTTAVADVVVPTIVVSDNDATKTKVAGDDAIKSITAKGDTSVGPLGRSLRTDLASGNRETEGNDAPQVDPSRFVSRVAKAVQTANDRGGPLQLRLSPPELGSLKIQLTVKDGGLSASLEADNSNARKLLLDHLPALRDRLADQNIRVDKFEVDVKQENSGGQTNSRGSNQNPYQQQEQQSGGRRASTSGVAAPEATVPITSSQVATVTSTGINLVI